MDHRIVRKKLDILRRLAADSSTEITGWQARQASNPWPGEYVFDGAWQDAALPSSFKAGKTVFLRTSIELSDSLPPEKTFLSFRFQELEALLRIDGAAYAGLDGNHTRVLAPRSGRLDLEIEANTVPAFAAHPELADNVGTFHGASITVANSDIE